MRLHRVSNLNPYSFAHADNDEQEGHCAHNPLHKFRRPERGASLPVCRLGERSLQLPLPELRPKGAVAANQEHHGDKSAGVQGEAGQNHWQGGHP